MLALAYYNNVHKQYYNFVEYDTVYVIVYDHCKPMVLRWQDFKVFRMWGYSK